MNTHVYYVLHLDNCEAETYFQRQCPRILYSVMYQLSVEMYSKNVQKINDLIYIRRMTLMTSSLTEYTSKD